MGTESWRKKQSKRRSSERGKRRRINEGGGECDGGQNSAGNLGIRDIKSKFRRRDLQGIKQKISSNVGCFLFFFLLLEEHYGDLSRAEVPLCQEIESIRQTTSYSLRRTQWDRRQRSYYKALVFCTQSLAKHCVALMDTGAALGVMKEQPRYPSHKPG